MAPMTLEEWAAKHPGYGPGTWRYERAKTIIEGRDRRLARKRTFRDWLDTNSYGPTSRYSPTNREFLWSLLGLGIAIALVTLLYSRPGNSVSDSVSAPTPSGEIVLRLEVW